MDLPLWVYSESYNLIPKYMTKQIITEPFNNAEKIDV